MDKTMSPDYALVEPEVNSGFVFKSLPSLLRLLGAATLLISVSLYLFQGWGQGSDLTRFFLLLGHTVGLAGVGLACSRWLNEQKGARLLLMLTLVFISANFAIIGGFVFSIWGSSVGDLHGSVTWVVSNSSSSLLSLASALVVLSPLAYFGFSVCARRSAKQFSWVFLLCNFALLIPSRNELFLVALVVTLFGTLLYFIRKAKAADVTLATREGLIARLILFVPLAVMLGRNMMHSVGVVMPFLMSLAILVVLRQLALSLSRNSATRALVEVVSIIPMLSAAACLGVWSVIDLGASLNAGLLVFASVFSGALFEASARAARASTPFSVLASLMLGVAFTLDVYLGATTISALFCVLAGVLLSTFAYLSERRVAMVIGVLMVVVGLAFFMINVFENFDFSGWVSMAVLGVSAIVLGSYVEKRGEKFKQGLISAKHSLSAWGY